MRFLSKYWNCRLVKTGSLYILQFALFTNQSSGTRKKSVLTPLQWLSNEANHVCTLVFTLYVYCYSLLVCMLYFTCLNSNHWRRKTTQFYSPVLMKMNYKVEKFCITRIKDSYIWLFYCDEYISNASEFRELCKITIWFLGKQLSGNNLIIPA